MTIVYYGTSHFISKIINKLGDIWYNDGYENGECSLYGQYDKYIIERAIESQDISCLCAHTYQVWV